MGAALVVWKVSVSLERLQNGLNLTPLATALVHETRSIQAEDLRRNLHSLRCRPSAYRRFRPTRLIKRQQAGIRRACRIKEQCLLRAVIIAWLGGLESFV